MTVDKLSRILPALGQPAQSQAKKETEGSTEAEAASAAPSEAVQLSANFGGGEEASEAGRKQRVDQLKKAVADGSYKPDSIEVAKSVARELFA